MKTFKEWFDELSPKTRDYVKNLCYRGSLYNFNSKDYFAHININDEKIASFLTDGSYYSQGSKKASIVLARMLKERGVDLPKTFKTLEEEYLDGENDALYCLLPKEEIIDILKRKAKVHNGLDLPEWLFIQEDLDNPDFSTLSLGRVSADKIDCIQEIVKTPENIRALYKNNPQYINIDEVDDRTQDIFDDLFFGEDGWTEEQKLTMIGKVSAMTSSVEKFMRNVVAVDMSYLQYIDRIVGKRPALATELYNEKKPESELEANFTIAQSYRYPVFFRKFFTIVGCCIRKTLPKTKAGSIGDNSALLRFYNFDVKQIFAALFSDMCDLGVNETDEGEQIEA